MENKKKQFEKIVKDHSDLIRLLSGRYVACRFGQEEIYSETLIKIWKYLDSYNPNKAQLNTWVGVITKSVAIGYLRMKKDVFATNEPKENCAVTYNTAFEKRELKQELNRAIEKLNGMQKDIVLYRLRGYKYNEISDVLTLPVGTVKANLNRATKELRKYVNIEFSQYITA